MGHLRNEPFFLASMHHLGCLTLVNDVTQTSGTKFEGNFPIGRVSDPVPLRELFRELSRDQECGAVRSVHVGVSSQ